MQNKINGYLVKYQDLEDLKIKLEELLLNEFKISDVNNTVQQNQVAQVFKLYKKVINSFDNNNQRL